jgi:plastocyanin
VAASAAAGLSGRGRATSGPSEHIVEITSFRFKPSSLNVRAGDTVTWINQDIAPHTATAENESWDTGQIDKGQQKSVIINDDTPKAYFCRFHPAMKAKLIIDA